MAKRDDTLSGRSSRADSQIQIRHGESCFGLTQYELVILRLIVERNWELAFGPVTGPPAGNGTKTARKR
jgi:hypothetical protein